MNEDIFEDGILDLDIPTDEQLKLDQLKREDEQRGKEIGSYLWRAGYMGYNILSNNGLVFIFNKTKTKKEQLKWLKKYCEVLHTYGIEATVDDYGDEPCICI